MRGPANAEQDVAGCSIETQGLCSICVGNLAGFPAFLHFSNRKPPLHPRSTGIGKPAPLVAQPWFPALPALSKLDGVAALVTEHASK